MVCGSSDKLTNEHVFPQWLQETPTGQAWVGVPIPNEPHQVGRLDSESGQLEYINRGKRQSPFDMQVKAVCANCNNGWMSRLETEFQPVLRRMLKPVPSLNSVEASIAEAWAIKSAGMFQMNDPGSRTMPNGLLHPLKNRMIPREFFRVLFFRTEEPSMQVRARHAGISFDITPSDGRAPFYLAADVTALGVQGVGFLVCFSTHGVEVLDQGIRPEKLVSLSTNKKRTSLPQRLLDDETIVAEETRSMIRLFAALNETTGNTLHLPATRGNWIVGDGRKW